MLGLASHLDLDVVRGEWEIGLGDPVVAARRVIALPTDAEQRQRLLEISRSRTEPTSRVERARIILAYLQDPSGLRRGAHDGGDAADRDTVPGARGGTGGDRGAR